MNLCERGELRVRFLKEMPATEKGTGNKFYVS
jgi:hypothetical protein